MAEALQFSSLFLIEYSKFSSHLQEKLGKTKEVLIWRNVGLKRNSIISMYKNDQCSVNHILQIHTYFQTNNHIHKHIQSQTCTCNDIYRHANEHTHTQPYLYTYAYTSTHSHTYTHTFRVVGLAGLQKEFKLLGDHWYQIHT